MATDGTGAAAPINILALSDEDILKMGVPPGTAPAASSEDDEEARKAAEAAAAAEAALGTGDAEASAAAASQAGSGEGEAKDPAAATQADKAEGEAGGAADPSAATVKEPEGEKKDLPAGSAEGGEKPGDKPGEKAAESSAPDYEGFYKRVMAPFKANGKTIELRTPDEAVQLMQMGANYTRKMQELVPHRKLLTMLQNNNLLDEGRISFLIDLDKKNPEAIKKLVKDSGMDVMDIDTTAEPAYLEGSHRVTDEEVNFRTALEELSSTPDGKETLQDINTRWDQSSKELLWKYPETFSLIDQQRKAGIYDRICTEIDRRRIIGTLSAQTPFLEAYKVVGDALTAANAFADLVEQHNGTATPDPAVLSGQGGSGGTPQPVATRVATPKPQVTNDDRASAASPTRASTKPAKEFVNPLAMSDDEFLKQFNGRL